MEINFLIDILLQQKPSEAIKENEETIFRIIPELKLCKGFSQNNNWHIYDVYEHILHVIDGVPNNIFLRMASLFHDIGKPLVYEEDENGIGHFYGHWEKSKEIFDKFATKYRIDDSTKSIISNLILYHDLNIDKISDDEIKKLINIFGRNGIIMLFQLKRSDLLAQNEQYHYMLEDYDKQEERLLSRHKVAEVNREGKKTKVILGTGSYYNVNSGNTVSITGDGGNAWGYYGPAYKKLAPRLITYTPYAEAYERLLKIKEDTLRLKEYIRLRRKIEDEYIASYYETRLKDLDVEELLCALESKFGDNIILLCHEPIDEFCHRRLVADYIELKTGMYIPEIAVSSDGVIRKLSPIRYKNRLKQAINKRK